jgi:hypothetical protein
MESIAVFGRLSGADRIKPVLIGADMNLLSANLDVGQPSVVSLCYAKDSMLVFIRHGFVFGVFLPINFAQVLYSIIKSVVIDMVNDVGEFAVSVKPRNSMGRKVVIVDGKGYISPRFTASLFSSVSKIPSVIIRFNEWFGPPRKNPSVGAIVENAF